MRNLRRRLAVAAVSALVVAAGCSPPPDIDVEGIEPQDPVALDKCAFLVHDSWVRGEPRWSDMDQCVAASEFAAGPWTALRERRVAWDTLQALERIAEDLAAVRRLLGGADLRALLGLLQDAGFQPGPTGDLGGIG